MADDVAAVARRGDRPRSETVLADQNPQAIFECPFGKLVNKLFNVRNTFAFRLFVKG